MAIFIYTMGFPILAILHPYIESGPRVTCPIDCLITGPCCLCSHFPPLPIVALFGSAPHQISQCGRKLGSLLTSQIVLVHQWVKIHGNHPFATEILLNLLKLPLVYLYDGWVQLRAIDYSWHIWGGRNKACHVEFWLRIIKIPLNLLSFLDIQIAQVASWLIESIKTMSM